MPRVPCAKEHSTFLVIGGRIIVNYFEIFIIQKGEEIYRYMLNGLFYKDQNCVKFYRTHKDFDDSLTYEEKIEMLKKETD